MKLQLWRMLLFSTAAVLFLTAGFTYYDTYVVPRCEVCGMSTIYGWRDVLTPDGVHHVSCCPLCTFLLVHKYSSFHVETVCDYCGREITIDVENGVLKKVDPPTAYLILAGSGQRKQSKIACSEECKDKLLMEAPPGSKPLTVKEAFRMASEPVRKYLLWHPITWPLIMELTVLGILTLAAGFAARKFLK
ncbi:MAG: hypothetical protein ACXQTQ_00360 [Candidatus Hecatellaceae archaeon]|nr:MAG: hypothetical protein DRO43_04785 [Candidatus Hecatellales archaeon]